MAARTANEAVNKLAQVATDKLHENNTVGHRLMDIGEQVVHKSIQDSTPDLDLVDPEDDDLEVLYNNLKKVKT